MSSRFTTARHDDAYRLDIELVDVPELRAQVASDPHREFERIDFQCFIYVRSGSYTHVVNFETGPMSGMSSMFWSNERKECCVRCPLRGRVCAA